MSEWNYCHGPNCHTYHTQSRIRGVKGNKVLRTRKVSKKSWWTQDWNTKWYHFFCDERCRSDYFDKHVQAIMRHEPRPEPLETSIEVTKETVNGYYGNRVETTITEINNNQ
jgi:hypothetical protein